MKIIDIGVFVFASAFALQAGTLVTFDAEVKSSIEHDSGKTNTVDQYQLKVFLGSGTIDVESDSGITVHDYENRKIYRSADGKEGYSQNSLFSDIGFRVYEFKNRLFLGKALEAASIQDNPMDRVLMEHLFSLSSEEPADLKREECTNKVSFGHNGKTLFEYSLTGPDVPKETVDKFTLYLRTVFGGHPDILKEINGLNYLPGRMTIYRYNTAKTEEIRLELKQVQPNSVRPERNLKAEIIPDSDPVFALAHKAREMDANSYASACDSILKRAAHMAGNGKYLDAASLFVGYGLASGKQDMPPAFFDWKDKIVADPDVRLMFAALSPQSKDDAQKAVGTYTDLAKKASDGRFSLMIFQANTLDSLDKPTEAIESFLTALRQEPAIVGAWKDLGDIYYTMYHAEQAWACWDAGRALNSRHKLFEEVLQMEISLQAEHPEFFMETQ